MDNSSIDKVDEKQSIDATEEFKVTEDLEKKLLDENVAEDLKVAEEFSSETKVLLDTVNVDPSNIDPSNPPKYVQLRRELTSLGDRIKELENVFFHRLDNNKYTIIRVDGNCFSTFTRSFDKPCDLRIVNAMKKASWAVMERFNCLCAYTQSDEASFIIDKRRLENVKTLPFNERAEKIASLIASLFSVEFNDFLKNLCVNYKARAIFDARIFQVETDLEVWEYIRWRQLDAFRNGVTSLAQSIFSSKKLDGKSVKNKLDMLPPDIKETYKNSHLIHGTFVKRVMYRVQTTRLGFCKANRTFPLYINLGEEYKIVSMDVQDILSKYASEKYAKYDEHHQNPNLYKE